MFSLWFRIEYLVALLNDSKVGKRSIYNVVTRTFLPFLAPYSVCLLYNSEIKWTLNVPSRVETTGRGISCIAPMRVCLASNLHKSPIAVQRCAPPEADTWALLYSFCTHCTLHCTLYRSDVQQTHKTTEPPLAPHPGTLSAILVYLLVTDRCGRGLVWKQ